MSDKSSVSPLSPLSSAPATVAQDEIRAVPLSFPAILRNPKNDSHYAYLHGEEAVGPSAHVSRKTRDDKEGRRWIRRKENARFAGNPHIVHASKKDLIPDPPRARATFPEPLPSYLPRNASVPSIQRSVADPNSANFGRFSLSLKGMRRELRKSGYRTRGLVRDIERELADWLTGGIMILPDSEKTAEFELPGRAIDEADAISEISRSPLQLVWSIENDAFARYVVHCCARYHKIVSSSKDTTGRRLTYLLRPNVTRPDFTATSALDTPPVTDIDYSSHVDSSEPETLSLGERDAMSEYSLSEPYSRPLSALSERSDKLETTLRTQETPITPDLLEDTGSIDGDEDESPADVDLSVSIDSLTLDPERTFRATQSVRSIPERQLLWDRRRPARSASSHSRSPSRQPARQIRSHINAGRRQLSSSPSFYDYLFS